MSKKKRRQKRGRSLSPVAIEEVEALVDDLPRQKELMIEYLHRIQDHFHCLSADHLHGVAKLLRLSQAEVYEVASFYHHFDFVKNDADKPHQLTVRVCDSISCEMQGSDALLEQLENNPTLSNVRIQRVPCVGRCDKAPVAVVGDSPVELASLEKIKEMIATPSVDELEIPQNPKAYALYAEIKQGFNQEKREQILSELDASSLRGLGGAGFPVGRKWRIVGDQPAPRMMAVNIDEGEPGTFKDRYYLETQPQRFIEGMLIAALVVGVETIVVYIRDEYTACRKMLKKEFEWLRDYQGFDVPKIQLRRGAGAYICGEESAMLESIEGKRGMPRLRPPFVAERGLFGHPTLVQNMESLHWVSLILEKGGDWFATQGRNGRSGLRSFSVSGRVKKSGVHVAPAGITLLELIDKYCGGMQEGHTLKGYLPGGASGGILPARLANVPLDFDTLQEHGCFIGSAAIIVFSDQDSAREIALNAMRFFKHESCGQCTPCRVGTSKAVSLMEKAEWEIALMQELSSVMQDASICGLGQAAPNPMDCVIRYFPEELVEQGEKHD